MFINIFASMQVVIVIITLCHRYVLRTYINETDTVPTRKVCFKVTVR